MRAAVVEAPGRLSVKNAEVPDPAACEVRIRLEGTGICASDLPVWEGRPWFQYPLSPGRPGHEGWGRVDAVGAGVLGLKPGDRVAAFSTSTYAEYDIARADEVVLLPDSLDGKPFPGEPLACAINSFRRCDVWEGDDVAIVGGGFQAMLMVQLAAQAQARVVLLSRRPFALELGRSLGADETVLLDDHVRVVERAMQLARADGYDRVIETTGYQWPLDIAGELTRVRGRLIIAGYHQEPRQVNMQLWNWRGIDVINAHERDPHMYQQGLARAVTAVKEGKLNPWPLLTHVFGLEDLDKALEIASKRPEGFIKAMISQ